MKEGTIEKEFELRRRHRDIPETMRFFMIWLGKA